MQTLSQYIANSGSERTHEEWAQVFGISRSRMTEILGGARPGWKTIIKIHEVTGGQVPPAAWLKSEDAA